MSQTGCDQWKAGNPSHSTKNFDPFAGVRVGEASNPGPSTNDRGTANVDGAWDDQALDKDNNAMWIVTQNIGSLYAAAERHTATKADVYAWQEAEVPMHERQVTAEKMRELGYTMRFGWEDNCTGGDEGSKVAMAFSEGNKSYALEYHDRDAVQLAASGRWCERMMHIMDGNKFIVVASLYGYSGASQDPAIARKNDELLRAAALRCAGFIGTPYYICTDANTNPQMCRAWREMLDKGLITDLPYEWGNGSPEYTYRNQGVYKGMSGPGITRIDTILCNEVGAQIVGDVQYLWGTSGANDHVGIAVKLEGTRIQQKVVRAGRPIGINLQKHKFKSGEHDTQRERERMQKEANDSFRRIWTAAQYDFEDALTRRDANETHRIWCRVCELWLYFNQG